MKRILNFLLAAGAVALAGCSSTPTKVDTGPIQARTFSFVSRGGKPTPDFADNTQLIHAMVQDAITKNLAGRGISRVDNGGDVTVGYLIIVGNNASTTAINDYFGYAADVTALHEKAQEAYVANNNPNFFEAGTLLIDITDSKNFKLLRRGYATRPILRNISDNARAERIQGVVDEILADVRVKQ
jgi:hypothetical protein